MREVGEVLGRAKDWGGGWGGLGFLYFKKPVRKTH